MHIYDSVRTKVGVWQAANHLGFTQEAIFFILGEDMDKGTDRRARALIVAGQLRQEVYFEMAHLDPWFMVFLYVYARTMFYATERFFYRTHVFFRGLLAGCSGYFKFAPRKKARSARVSMSAKAPSFSHATGRQRSV
jgi:hypothetical protein